MGEVVPRVLSFFLLPVLTKYLSTSDYGINGYITSLITFIYVLCSLSLNTYLLRYYNERKTADDKARLTGGLFLLITGANIVFLALEFGMFPLYLKWFKVGIPFYPLFFLAAINNFFEVLSIIPLTLYRVRGKAPGFVAINLMRTLLQVTAVYIFVARLHDGLVGMFYGRLIVNSLFVIVYLAIIRKYGHFKIDKKMSWDALKFSLPLIPGAVSYLLLTTFDRVILEPNISLGDLGLYSVAYTIAISLNIVIQAFYKSFEPIIFREINAESFERTAYNLYRFFLFTIFLFGFALALGSPEVFRIVTSKAFYAGHRIVPFLVISVVIAGINTFLGTLLVARGRQKQISASLVCASLVSLALNLILDPVLGYWGAVIGSITAFLVSNVYFHVLLRLSYNLIGRQLLALGLAISILFLFNMDLHAYPLVLIVAIKGVVVLLFAWLNVFLFGFNKTVWLFVKNSVKKISERRGANV